jgi:site-specific DNA recombinase
MRAERTNKAASVRPTVRCAIYTRKSTEEGLQQEFNTLHNQRESAEAYIRSQAATGWVCLPERYDDGGFTGGNMDRPALRRLLDDIEAGRVDCVVVYKIDRLSRSLLDFARMMDTFERRQVAFVSTTQQFNTATSMGRLVLNMLSSFAQYERELVSERTRDKIAATRRRGKWTGGHPLLGYDVDEHTRLVVNEDEAARVRAIFALYLDHEALLPVVQELERRGWTTKRWTTRKGNERGGQPFTKTGLHQHLTNPVYYGKVKYKTELHDGEHEALIDAETWRKMQTTLLRNGRSGGAPVRNQFGFLLKGLMHCVPCRCAMTPSHTSKNKARRYRYYTCTNAQKRGWDTCPSKSVPAGEIERFVVEQVRCVGRDPALRRETFVEAFAQFQVRLEKLAAERRVLERDLAAWEAEVRTLVDRPAPADAAPDPLLIDLHERLRTGGDRLRQIDAEAEALNRGQVTEAEVDAALADFDGLWESLASHEQARLLRLLVERVDYDGGANTVSVSFHPTGIQALADAIASQQKEKSA